MSYFPQFNNQSEAPQQEATCFQITSGCVSLVASVALFIIICMGAAGHFTGAQLGKAILGASAPAVALEIFAQKWKENPCSSAVMTLLSMLPIILGSLALTGIITPYAASWGLLGPAIAIGGLGALIGIGYVIYLGCMMRKAT